MIKLDTAYTTTISHTFGTTTVAATTDTLFVRSVTQDFTTGAMYATVQRGTVDATGKFVSNYPDMQLTINPDGSFISQDGTWQGTVATAPTLVANLKTQFDQFVLASGKVTGTII